MTKRKKMLSVTAVVFGMVFFLTTLVLCFTWHRFTKVSASTDGAGEIEEMRYDTSGNLKVPDYEGATIYNCMVTYGYTQRSGHAEYIQLLPDETNPYVSYDLYAYPGNTSYYAVLPVMSVDNLCDPDFEYYRAHNPNEQTYSDIANIWDGVGMHESPLKSCLYPINPSSIYFRSEEFPTEYDDAHTWNHGADTNNIIHFTIAYKGIAQDESIKIPLLGYAEKSLTITYQNGFKNESVTFSVRVGPNRLSVKASVPVDCNNYDTMFAFQNYSVDE